MSETVGVEIIEDDMFLTLIAIPPFVLSFVICSGVVSACLV